jgi:hypothetical protein
VLGRLKPRGAVHLFWKETLTCDGWARTLCGNYGRLISVDEEMDDDDEPTCGQCRRGTRC